MIISAEVHYPEDQADADRMIARLEKVLVALRAIIEQKEKNDGERSTPSTERT